MPIDANGNIIPDFGDKPASTTSTSSTAGESSGGGYAGPRKMAFICSKGNLDMAYPALIMANAALGEGIETHIFFTFWGLDLVDVRTMDNLKFTFTGNTAMHMPQLERFIGGSAAASMPQLLSILPGVTTAGTKLMNKMLADLDIPPVRGMIEQVSMMGAHMWACKLTVDMMQIKEANLHPAIEGVISATDFIEKAEGAQIVFV